MQNLTYRIKALGTEITDQMLNSKILVTLPESYKSFVTAWESTTEDKKTIENLTSRPLLEEMRNHEEEIKQAKQLRLPFGEKGRTKRPLKLIHTDLYGSVDPFTWDEKRYMLTLIDDYTHFTMVYLIKNKSE